MRAEIRAAGRVDLSVSLRVLPHEKSNDIQKWETWGLEGRINRAPVRNADYTSISRKVWQP